MSSLKLSAGGSNYISQCLRYYCPNCKRDFLVHPDRWKVHMEDCFSGLALSELIYLRDQAQDVTTKQGVELAMLECHDSTTN
jgi:hypothetical protein